MKCRKWSEQYNIFDYYRGPSRDGDRQTAITIENNVTKAFINVLQLSSEDVRTEFIQWLSKETGIELVPSTIEDFRLLKKRLNDDCKGTRTKVMLGIQPYWAHDTEKTRAGKKSRYYDAAIIGQGQEWIVAIESKINSGMDAKQFETQRRQLGIGIKKRTITWSGIGDDFSRVLKDLSEQSIDAFLIRQFCCYLESSGQLPFKGLKKPEYFDFFKHRHDDAIQEENDDIRLELRGLMNTLGGDIYEYTLKRNQKTKERLYPEWDYVKGLNVGQEKWVCAYVPFYPFRWRTTEMGKHKKSSLACVCVELNGNGIDTYIEVSGSSINKFRSLTKSPEGKNLLMREVKKIRYQLPIDYSVELFLYRNEERYTSLYKFAVKIDTEETTLRSHIDRVAKLTQKHSRNKDLKLTITRHFPKPKVIGYKRGSDLVHDMAHTMQAFYPLLKSINGRKRTRRS